MIEAFQDFKDAENIDRPTLMRVVEDVFKTLLRKKYGDDTNFDVIVNAEKGDLEIVRRRIIVPDGEVLDANAETTAPAPSSITALTDKSTQLTPFPLTRILCCPSSDSLSCPPNAWAS